MFTLLVASVSNCSHLLMNITDISLVRAYPALGGHSFTTLKRMQWRAAAHLADTSYGLVYSIFLYTDNIKKSIPYIEGSEMEKCSIITHHSGWNCSGR